jgi:hypothetical protein
MLNHLSRQEAEPNPRAVIGANNPPATLFDLVRGAMARLGAFLENHPTLDTFEDAKAANTIRDATARTLADLEAERVAKVKPLNDQVTAINAEYKALHNTDVKRPGTADKLLTALKARMTAYAKAEETKREAIAQAAYEAAQKLEHVARDAEAKEKEAHKNAAVGECVDVAAITQDADEAFAAFQQADHAALRADRNTKVRITGGLGNAASLRSHEVLSITDYQAAIDDMGLTEAIAEAILVSARAYRKAVGELPSGIATTTERKI